MKSVLVFLFLLMSVAATPSWATGMQVCTADPATPRMSAEQASARARLMGYKVVAIEPDQGCWRVEVIGDRGRKYVLRLHAATGEMMARFEPGGIDRSQTAATD